MRAKAELFAEERQELLLEILRSKGKVFTRNASAHFGVSPDTIRRDLDGFVRAGIAYRVHGGAVITTAPARGVQFEKKGVDDRKRAVGKKAASLVESDSLIIFDSGSSSLEVAKNIPIDLRFTAVTNNLAAAKVLSRRPRTQVIVLGGRILKASMSLVGDQALALLKSIRADICF